MTIWKPGRGPLGPLKPLLGSWITKAKGTGKAGAMACTREFMLFGGGYIQLDARWKIGPAKEYREIAFFGKDEDGRLAFWSFTNDGKKAQGVQTGATDVHPQALAFEARMPAGIARMIYWPDGNGQDFNFAVESKAKKGWNRFFQHLYHKA